METAILTFNGRERLLDGNGETEFFGTETMAEVCARQGRLADAVEIYRRLLELRPQDPRKDQWTSRYQALQRAVGFRGDGAAAARQAAARNPGSAPAAATAGDTDRVVVAPDPGRVGGSAVATRPVTPPPIPRVAAAAAIDKTPVVQRRTTAEQAAWEALAQATQVHRLPLLITQPVRSGQVIRAEKNDLIVLGPVNPGAQLVADGNIHVYGPLRGQAIAGAMGCDHARIFCQKLHAELVAINGIYLIYEDIPPGFLGGPAQIYLHDGRCLVDRL